MNILFEQIIASDPALKLFLREGSLNSKTNKEFNNKADLRISGFKIALKRYLDIRSRT